MPFWITPAVNSSREPILLAASWMENCTSQLYKRQGCGVMLYFRHISYQEGLSKSHFQRKEVKQN